MSQKIIEIGQEDLIKQFVNDFKSHLETDDALQKILYGQIHIEYALNSLIENSVPFPSKLNLERQTFFNKIRLLTSLGLIHPDLSQTLEKIGNIRNELAHNIDATFTKKQEADFINILKQSHLKTEFKNSKKIWKNDYACAIWCVWSYLFKQIINVIIHAEDFEKIRQKIVAVQPEEKSKNNLPKSFSISLIKNFEDYIPNNGGKHAE